MFGVYLVVVSRLKRPPPRFGPIKKAHPQGVSFMFGIVFLFGSLGRLFLKTPVYRSLVGSPPLHDRLPPGETVVMMMDMGELHHGPIHWEQI